MKAWTSVFVESMSRDRLTRRSWRSQWKPDEQTLATCLSRERSDEKSLLEHRHDHLLFLCQTVLTELCCQAELRCFDPAHSNSVFSAFNSIKQDYNQDLSHVQLNSAFPFLTQLAISFPAVAILSDLPMTGWPGWVSLAGWLHIKTVYLPECCQCHLYHY